MSRPDKSKLDTSGGANLAHNPFGGLGAGGALDGLKGLPEGPVAVPGKAVTKVEPERNRGRVDVVRTTAGRGGKTVTVAKNFVGIGGQEKEALCKKMRAAAGCGGTVKDGAIEIQGDQREVVVKVLREAGFRPVLAGG